MGREREDSRDRPAPQHPIEGTEGASPAEQRVLEAMARLEGRVPLSRLHAALPEVSGLNLLVRRLVERGLIYRATRGAYDFALPIPQTGAPSHDVGDTVITYLLVGTIDRPMRVRVGRRSVVARPEGTDVRVPLSLPPGLSRVAIEVEGADAGETAVSVGAARLVPS